MKTEAQRFARRHSMRAAGDPMRLVAAAAVLLLMSAADGTPARADMTVVQQDKTPIVSWPGVGGRILTHVDAGFPLIVLGRDGEWLKVASPELKLPGVLWVPVARVGDIAGAPLAFASSQALSTTAIVPQFRIMTDTADGMGTAMPGTTTVGSNVSTSGVSSATARSGSSNATGGAAQATANATPAATDVTSELGNPTPAMTGNPTPAVSGNPTPAVSGNPTPALGNSVSPVGISTPAVSNNPTPAVSGNPTPAVTGNPTPALGNPTPAFSGNPTPALGNVGGFGTHATQ